MTSRVAGPTELAHTIGRALTESAHALSQQVSSATDRKRRLKATAEGEATRVWAQQQRERFGQTEEFCAGVLGLALAERRTFENHRARMPMWKKVLYAADVLGLDVAESAVFIGVDETTIIAQLPVARAILRECQDEASHS